MANRENARHLVRLPAKLTGTDALGNRFVQTTFTRDISARGVRLTQVPPLLHVAEVVHLEYRRKRSRFRVVWVGGIGDEVGLMSLEPQHCIWGHPLPGRPVRSVA